MAVLDLVYKFCLLCLKCAKGVPHPWPTTHGVSLLGTQVSPLSAPITTVPFTERTPIHLGGLRKHFLLQVYSDPWVGVSDPDGLCTRYGSRILDSVFSFSFPNQFTRILNIKDSKVPQEKNTNSKYASFFLGAGEDWSHSALSSEGRSLHPEEGGGY